MKKKIAVLLATCNGEKYLNEQLDSIINQNVNLIIHIFVSDDASKDRTLSICKSKKYKSLIKKIFHVSFNSFSKNFLNLIQVIPSSYDYYAFSDQDDIWKMNKLSTAIKKLNKFNLYCSRTTYVSANKKFIGYSPLFLRKPSFENAIVQSIAGGNTMVFDKKLFKKFKKEKILNAPSYDWILYIFVTIAGMKIYYDKNSNILYRQHSTNLVGSNTGIYNKIIRLILVFKGRFKKWNENHLDIIKKFSFEIDKNSKCVLDQFIKLRSNYFFLIKSIIYKEIKIFRQTYLSNLSLKIALLLKLI